MKKYKFAYASWASATVTVRARTEPDARLKASDEMDRRYERQGLEPPVGWTFKLLAVLDL